jgi:hypothetical protein
VVGGGGLSIEQLAGKSLVTDLLYGCAQQSFTLLLENAEALRTKERRDRDSTRKTGGLYQTAQENEPQNRGFNLFVISSSFPQNMLASDSEK